MGVAKLPLIELEPETPKEYELRLLPSLDMLKVKDKEDRGTLTNKVSQQPGFIDTVKVMEFVFLFVNLHFVGISSFQHSYFYYIKPTREGQYVMMNFFKQQMPVAGLLQPLIYTGGCSGSLDRKDWFIKHLQLLGSTIDGTFYDTAFYY